MRGSWGLPGNLPGCASVECEERQRIAFAARIAYACMDEFIRKEKLTGYAVLFSLGSLTVDFDNRSAFPRSKGVGDGCATGIDTGHDHVSRTRAEYIRPTPAKHLGRAGPRHLDQPGRPHPGDLLRKPASVPDRPANTL